MEASRKLSAWKLAPEIVAILIVLGTALPSRAQAQTSYPAMAPIDQYRMAHDAEIAMARSAAPESISRDAEILVLGQHNFETVAKGTNGFVCMVQRSWSAGVDDPVFWNPRIRGPICLNAAASRSYLPNTVKKTEWVLAGLTKSQIAEKIKAALDSKELTVPEPGSMCYMMSKDGYLSDQGRNWRPHLMFFVPGTDTKAWGADLLGSPMLSATDPVERLTIFMLPVAKWSDGTAAPPM